jgi:hypothetical protein
MVMLYLAAGIGFQPGFKFFDKQYKGPKHDDPRGINKELKPLKPVEFAGVRVAQVNTGDHDPHSKIDQGGRRDVCGSFMHGGF